MFGKDLRLTFAVLCALLLGACSRPPAGAASFTLVSDQTNKMSKHYVSVGVPVESKDCFVTLLYHAIWFGTIPVEETLLSRMLEEHKADALIDAEFKHSLAFFPLIFSRSCLTISGTPVKLRETP